MTRRRVEAAPEIYNEVNKISGTAGWTRTTDLLIHIRILVSKNLTTPFFDNQTISVEISICFVGSGATPTAIVSAIIPSMRPADLRLLGLRSPASSTVISVFATHMVSTGLLPWASSTSSRTVIQGCMSGIPEATVIILTAEERAELGGLARSRHDAQGLRWRWKSVRAPRPLYNLNNLAAHPGAPVVICEGEKAADATMDEVSALGRLDLPIATGKAARKIVPPRSRIPRWKGLCADSEEKHAPASDPIP